MDDLSDHIRKKEDYRIIIMGSYDNGCMNRLESLRNALQSIKYKNAKLVANIDDSPYFDDLNFNKDVNYDYKKSVYGIKWSSIILFVFFKDCIYESVITEIHESVRARKNQCVEIFIEKNAKLRGVSTGVINEHRFNQTIFNNDKELYLLAGRNCWLHLISSKCP